MTTWAVKREILVLVGLPFSGKTTRAQELMKEAPGSLLIERDVFLERVGNSPQLVERLMTEAKEISEPISRLFPSLLENAYNDALSREYVRYVTELIQGSDAPRVIVDGTHLQALSRSFIQNFPEAHRVAMVIPTSVYECVSRFLCAGSPQGVRRSLTVEKIHNMQRFFELPSAGEGFEESL